jgi:polyphosphate:AMP phosphotransferase
MFESAELGHKLSKEEFRNEEPALREKLLDVQSELKEKASFSVVVVIAGLDGAGKGDITNLLSEWFDPRHVTTHALGYPNEEQAQRPPLYRAWQVLPPKGKIGVFVGSWYTRPLHDRTTKRMGKTEFDLALREIKNFETLLANEDVLVLKFWLHLSKKAQRKRLAELEDNPRTAWRVSKQDWENHAMYDRFRRIAERGLRLTSTAEAPWHVIEASDREYRALAVGKILYESISKKLAAPHHPPATHTPPRLQPLDDVRILDRLDMSLSMEKEAYEDALEEYQGKLNRLFRHPEMQRRSLVAVFEGQDAAGKGGAIRRITGALDARQYRIIPIAAPTADERARPYLWRFWRAMPGHGQITIFDRSWYGRVLVERVEGFCSEEDWMRGYAEINDFEEQLDRNGTIVVKFWLQISEEEQLRRFQERETTTFKRYKLGPEDWRNREKWNAYRDAVNEMVERTSTEYAPWTLVEANDKKYARVKILSTLCDRIEREL